MRDRFQYRRCAHVKAELTFATCFFSETIDCEQTGMVFIEADFRDENDAHT